MRHQEFDRNEALNEALHVFWKKGYANTSIEDLVAATSVSRYGLYGEFRNKHGIFLACIDRYDALVTDLSFGIVERPGASVGEVRLYFLKLLEFAATELGRRGCFMTNTANEVASYDRRAADKVGRFRDRLRVGFKRALICATDKREFPAKSDPAKTADFLTGVVQGLSVMARSSAGETMMGNVVDIALDCLKT